MSYVLLFVRTLGWSSVGALTAIAGYILASDYTAAQTAFVIAFFTAVGSGILAVVQRLANFSQETALKRAASQAAQYFLAAVGTLAVAEASVSAVRSWGEVILRAAVASLVAGCAAYVANKDAPAVAPAPRA